MVAGKSSGLLDLGESVTWEARHLGMRLRQGATITQLERPNAFIDESTTGPLRFRHVHRSFAEGKAVRMLDEFDFNLASASWARSRTDWS